MRDIRVNQITERTNKPIGVVARQRILQYFTLIMTVVLSMIFVKSVPAQKVILETGFENHVQHDRDSPFQTSTRIVKSGKKSLEIFSQRDNELHVSGFEFETDKSIISVEFWVYIKRGRRSFSVHIHPGDRAFIPDAGGPYIGWQDGKVRYHVHRGDPWRDLSDFPVNKWHYVRIVADYEKDQYDFYSGKNREAALVSRPKKDLPFSDPAVAPHPKWFNLIAYEMTEPAYIDDLLIYEGDEPISFAVEPDTKLTTLWGQLKRNQHQF